MNILEVLKHEKPFRLRIMNIHGEFTYLNFSTPIFDNQHGFNMSGMTYNWIISEEWELTPVCPRCGHEEWK